MKCTILHESRGRLRVHVCNVRMTLHRADVLEAYLNHHDAVSKAKVYERTGDVVVYYTGSRKDAVAALSTYRFDDPELDALVTSADSRRINQEYQEKMYNLLAGRVLRNLFLPAPLNAAEIFRSMHTIKGSSAMLEFDSLMEIAHHIEDLFFYIRENGMDALSPDQKSELFNLMFSSTDKLREEVE